MPNISLVWEMGEGLGHITRLKAIADKLQSMGYSITLLLKDPEQFQKFFSSDVSPEYRIIQAPTWPEKQAKLSRKPANLSELLLANGYHDTNKLAEKIQSWRQHLLSLHPDVVLFDYAPTALLAVRDCPFIKIGLDDPFSTPPNSQPLPSFDTDQRLSKANLIASDTMLVKSINQSLQLCKLPAITSAADVFNTDKSFLLSVKEIDPFADLRSPPQYYGCITTDNHKNKQLEWPHNSSRKKVFAYLKPNYPKLKPFLDGLSQLHVEARVFIPGLKLGAYNNFEHAHVHLSSQAYDLSTCEELDLIICHGGHSTVFNAMRNGVPALYIPLQQEQLATAQQSIRNGLGLGLGPHVGDADKIKAVLNELIFTKLYSDRAKQHQKNYQTLFKETAIKKIIEFIELRI